MTDAALWTWILAEHAFDAQLETYPKNPWFHDVTPDEFSDYYEAKLDRIEQLSGECKRGGCTETAEFPRDYCSDECMNIGLEQAMERVVDLFDRHGIDPGTR